MPVPIETARPTPTEEYIWWLSDLADSIPSHEVRRAIKTVVHALDGVQMFGSYPCCAPELSFRAVRELAGLSRHLDPETPPVVRDYIAYQSRRAVSAAQLLLREARY
jgi:hypothetical protein